MRGGYSGDRDSKKALRGFEIIRMIIPSFFDETQGMALFEPHRVYCVFLLGRANTQIPAIGIFCPHRQGWNRQNASCPVIMLHALLERGISALLRRLMSAGGLRGIAPLGGLTGCAMPWGAPVCDTTVKPTVAGSDRHCAYGCPWSGDRCPVYPAA